jgi:uncharacterized membrane protein
MARTDPTRRARRQAWALVAVVALLLIGWSMPPGIATAHGKEVSIAVASLTPDPDEPLHRLYRARVTYSSDDDPVVGAAVTLTARRAGEQVALPALRLTEIGDAPGLYVGEVVFERFGAWEVELEVRAVLGQGEGSVTFEDDIRPESLNPAEEAARQAEAERVARLQLLFRFDWWPDVFTIAARVLHALAGLAYFMLTGLVFGLAWFGIPSGAPDLPRRLDRVFRPVAATSLGLLLVAGLYGAAFDAPVAFPGIYDLEAMRRIPYGDAYLAAFLLKVLLFWGLAALAVRMGRTLHQWMAGAVPSIDDPAVAALRRTTAINAAVGIAVVVDVAVLVYLHYASHLGAFLPP